MSKSKLAVHLLRIAVVAIVFLGATAPGATSVFFFSDPLMGVLAVVNLLALLMMFPTAMRLLKDYKEQLKAGIEDPVFDPAKFTDLDIDTEAWKQK